MVAPVVVNALSRLLFEHEWSDADLAAHTGLSRARINRLKNRRARPTVGDALLISRALGVPVARIFALSRERAPAIEPVDE